MSNDDGATPALSAASLTGMATVALPADVVARLARLDVLERQFEQVVEQAKLAALKEFAYGAGHEINNPLANISARAQTLLKDECDPERRRKLSAINAQAFRAHEMIADLMLFARPPQLKLQPLQLPALIDDLIATLVDEANRHRVQIARVANGPLRPISADATQFTVAIRALVCNALEAIGLDGKIAIELSQTAQLTTIVVRDDGPGIPPEIRPRIFDPYFSGREAGRGLGFGLSKAWRIVTAHGGTLEVAANQPRGAVMRIQLHGIESSAGSDDASC